MNSKFIMFIKNFSYTIISNFISMFISTMVVLIIPKVIGITEYGYWQVYMFYSAYVGFLHFGWNDGIYLRYGGKKYDQLDRKLFFSQFYMLILFQVLLSIIISIIVIFTIIDINRIYIFEMIALCMIITNVRYMLMYILQCTNRIKDYAQITILDRVLYCFMIITFIILGVKEYRVLILADVICKFISLIYAMYKCKELVFQKIFSFYISLIETFENIRVGIKLMIANIASTLIVGVVRIGIERTWSIETFGKVSLTLSISNLMMIFINSVAIIIFPILRRIDKNKLRDIYITIREALMVLLLGLLIIYYPIKEVLQLWLPKYTESLRYMALVFPMCVYEGKVSLLVNTYLKTLRKEKLMLRINLISLCLSVFITFFCTVLIKNLDLAILSILFVLAIRCVIAEIVVSKIINIYLYKNIILEIFMTLVFILSGWFVNSLLGFLFYSIAYLIYLYIKKRDIIKAIKEMKLLINDKR